MSGCRSAAANEEKGMDGLAAHQPSPQTLAARAEKAKATNHQDTPPDAFACDRG
jgi:hypothetical protein